MFQVQNRISQKEDTAFNKLLLGIQLRYLSYKVAIIVIKMYLKLQAALINNLDPDGYSNSRMNPNPYALNMDLTIEYMYSKDKLI